MQCLYNNDTIYFQIGWHEPSFHQVAFSYTEHQLYLLSCLNYRLNKPKNEPALLAVATLTPWSQ